MPRLITPLSSLEIFAEAGRSGSFKLAAVNLSLTTSAVSQSVRKLEDRLGCDLFARANNKLSLTAEGALLLRHIEEGMNSIRQGLEAISLDDARPFSFCSPPGIAAQLLGPALVNLMSTHATDIRITADEAPDFRSYRKFDVAIIYGLGAQQLEDVEPLGPDVFVPVCAPHLAASIQSMEDLKSHLLLTNETNAVSWEDWFRLNRASNKSTRRLSYNRINYIMPALLQGAGVSLETVRLLSPQIARGELAVCEIPGALPVVENLTFLHVTTDSRRRPRAIDIAQLIRERCHTDQHGYLVNSSAEI